MIEKSVKRVRKEFSDTLDFMAETREVVLMVRYLKNVKQIFRIEYIKSEKYVDNPKGVPLK